MYIWLTLISISASGALLSELWFRKKAGNILKIIISAAACAAVFAGCSFVAAPSVSFFAATTASVLTCLIYDLFKNEAELLFPEFCLLAGLYLTLLPFALTDELWDASVWPAAVIVCLVLVPLSTNRFKMPGTAGDLKDLFQKNRPLYFAASALPLIPALIFVSITAFAGGLLPAAAVIFSLAFILIFSFSLIIQLLLFRNSAYRSSNGELLRWNGEAREYMNTIRSQRHDFNLHLHAISGLIAGKKYDECNEYINKLTTEAADINDIMPVNDAVIGSMLYNMREAARRKGSDISYHITYDMKDILCNAFECNKIIGNLLQNAIDALQSGEDKAYGINLSIFKRGGNTVIICENRFTGDPKRIARVFDAGYSTKRGHEGIGLSMVQRTAANYGGRIYPEFGDETIRFIVNIPNKVSL